MSGTMVKSLTIWLLVGPPLLCRGGVLVDCCDHPPVESPPAVMMPSCCDSSSCCPTSDQSAPPQEEQSPRKCRDCTAICASKAKVSDDITLVDFADVVVAALGVDSQLGTPSLAVFPKRAEVPRRLPFPASDVPLLI